MGADDRRTELQNRTTALNADAINAMVALGPDRVHEWIDARQSEASEFWVRVGNTTKQLHADNMLENQADPWG